MIPSSSPLAKEAGRVKKRIFLLLDNFKKILYDGFVTPAYHPRFELLRKFPIPLLASPLKGEEGSDYLPLQGEGEPCTT